MAAMRAGQDVEVTAYDRANVNPLSVGKIVALDSQIDPTTGTVKLRANFANLWSGPLRLDRIRLLI
jgi:multidrug efflux system membrane fusion protein